MPAPRLIRRRGLTGALVATLSTLVLVACSSAPELDLTDPTPGPTACKVAGSQAGAAGAAEENLFKIALNKVGDEAISSAAGDGVSWALHLITGSGDKSAAELEQIEKQLNGVQDQVGKLQTQLLQLSTRAEMDFQQLKIQINNVNFSNRVTHLQNDEAQVNAYQTAYNQIVQSSANRPGYTLTSDDAAALYNMRASAANLPSVMENIISTMNGTGVGTDGPVIDLWTPLVWSDAGYAGSKDDGVYTSAYVEQASTPYNYAGALLSQAMRLYANSMHVTFAFQGQTYAVEDGPSNLVCTYYNKASAALKTWSTQTSKGTGPIPAGTVVDLRDKDDALLWSDGPITPNGGYSDWYCGTGAGYCYADEWATLSSSTPPEVVGTKAVRDVKLADGQVASIGGWNDWRIPRLTANDDDLATLGDHNPDPSKAVDLTDWGKLYGWSLTKYTDVTVVGHGARNGSKVTMLRPVLVDKSAPGADDKVYDVAVGASYAKRYTVVDRPAQAGRAARVVVVRDFTPETEGGSMPSDSPAPLQDTEVTSAQGQRVPRPARLRSTPGPTVSFTKPGDCTQNPYQVPDDVTALQVDAVGGAGGKGPNPAANKEPDGAPSRGGQGGWVTGTVPVVPGSTVYVQVGGSGADGGAGGAGGAGNGAAGGTGPLHAGGGGGLSGVSTDTGCARWLIAAGGGGGAGVGYTSDGQVVFGGNGGDAGQPGSVGAVNVCTQGKSFPDGSGGQSTLYCQGTAGADGKPLAGGAGGSGTRPGGGGGAGFWTSGGGGAGAGDNKKGAVGAGAAGGDSYLTDPTPWGFDPASFRTTTAAPHVTISPIQGTPVTRVALKVSATSLHPKDPVTLTATIGNAPRASGSVQFGCAETASIGDPVPVKDGTATLTLPTDLGTGTRHITATFSGAGPYGPGTSDPVAVDISMLKPSLTIGISPSHVVKGHNPTITVTGPKDMAGEKLTVSDRDQNSLGDVTLDKTGTGLLTALNATLEVGTHWIHASSGADGRYLATDTAESPLTVTSS